MPWKLTSQWRLWYQEAIIITKPLNYEHVHIYKCMYVTHLSSIASCLIPSTLDVQECTHALNPVNCIQLACNVLQCSYVCISDVLEYIRSINIHKCIEDSYVPLMDWKVSKISPDSEGNSLSNTIMAFFLFPSHLVTQRHMMFLNSSILGWTPSLSLSLTSKLAICSLNGSISPDKDHNAATE